MVVYLKDWAEIEDHYDERFDLTGLTPAEQDLKEAVAKGRGCDFSPNLPNENALPPKPDDWDEPDPTRHIRAEVLRFVLLQKVKHERMTEAGTRLYGAQITGRLDLNEATIPTRCSLIACRFENAVTANRAQFNSQAIFDHNVLSSFSAIDATITGQLSFEGARFETTNGQALVLQGAQIGSAVFLCKLSTGGTIDIKGAKIASQLNCMGARFEAKTGKALDLQGAQIGDNVNLSDVTATSSIDIVGTTIKGQLSCLRARLEATNGKALSLQQTEVHGGLFFREVNSVVGTINLNAAYISTIFDDATSWALVDTLFMDGCRYDRISGDTKPTFSERMDWLEKGSVWKDEFFPQPYTQLADTYKRAGHDREAREVRVALAGKLHEQYVGEIKKSLAAPSSQNETLAHLFGRPLIFSLHTMDWLFKSVVGYGFKPARSIGWLLGMICILTVLSFATWRTGDFTPNSAPILVSQGWVDVAHEENAAQAWSADGAAGQDWESFNSFAYAADIVIPIVEIGQTSAWAPSPTRGAWGWTLWWMRWVFTAAGWIISALGAAAITGVIRRE